MNQNCKECSNLKFHREAKVDNCCFFFSPCCYGCKKEWGRFKDGSKDKTSIVISLKCFQEGLEALWCFSFAGVQWGPGEQGLAVQRGFATWWPGFLYSLVPGGISYLPSGSWP